MIIHPSVASYTRLSATAYKSPYYWNVAKGATPKATRWMLTLLKLVLGRPFVCQFGVTIFCICAVISACSLGGRQVVVVVVGSIPTSTRRWRIDRLRGRSRWIRPVSRLRDRRTNASRWRAGVPIARDGVLRFAHMIGHFAEIAHRLRQHVRHRL